MNRIINKQTDKNIEKDHEKLQEFIKREKNYRLKISGFFVPECIEEKLKKSVLKKQQKTEVY
jgi:hypothetical protein